MCFNIIKTDHLNIELMLTSGASFILHTPQDGQQHHLQKLGSRMVIENISCFLVISYDVYIAFKEMPLYDKGCP
jgi:hypothetical protein